MNYTKHNEIFFHNKIKTILLKKTKDADEMKNLRTISIIPAWLMVCEKLASKGINQILEGHITKNKFGFQTGRDCGIATATVMMKVKENGFNKILLIDIKKAYDSVDLETLKKIIIKKIPNNAILLDFINIYQQLTMIINDEKINFTRGLPQGSALSPIFFNIYINKVLTNIIGNQDFAGQAYADNTILQAKDIKIL